jgi:hypothetical protein
MKKMATKPVKDNDKDIRRQRYTIQPINTKNTLTVPFKDVNESREEETSKEMSMTDPYSDVNFEGISELNSCERFRKLSNSYQLPLFKIHKTLGVLMNREYSQHLPLPLRVAPSLNVVRKRIIKRKETIFRSKKSKSVNTRKNVDFAKKLTKIEHQYFTIMNGIKVNYIRHVLSNKEIYKEYVRMSKANISFTDSEEFKSQMQKIMSQKIKYVQKTKFHKSNNKTKIIYRI